MRAVVVILAVAAMAVASAPAFAQSAQAGDVAGWIKLIDSQPADLDRAAWKERRRDAARKLVGSKDKKAVPTLIKLAETETFDIIGEIAIEGLGNFNDPAVVPVLQKIANDPARDKAQRDLAKKSLGKLGASTTAGATTGPKPTGGGTSPAGGTTTGATGGTTGTTGGTTITGGATATTETDVTTGLETGTPAVTEPAAGAASGSVLLGEKPVAAVGLPVMTDDTIAAYERLTFVGGVASFGYDTVRKRMAFDADAGGLYAKRIEREKLAWGMDLGAHVVAGMINPKGRQQNRGAQIDIAGTGEVRFYSGKLYGIGKAAAGTQINYVSYSHETNPDADFKDTRTTFDLQVAIGGGYGRVVDVGAAIRVRRLSRTLDAARALGKPIDPATARRLQLTWWSLRGERSTYTALVATVAILREAGILLGEPDAGLAYEILNVLRDSQLFLRPSGLDIQLAISEGYLLRPDYPDGTPNAAGEHGRVEQLLALAGYGTQLADDTLELAGHAYARYRLFAPSEGEDAQPTPWALGATARMRRFTYGDHGDPIGMVDLGGDVMLSSDDDGSDNDEQGGDIGLRLGGELGFTWWLNQASGVRLAASIIADGGEVFIGANLSATYGLLDATFAGP
ncbi:MAG: HEAT repeat domain-containing protein [Deltaproteobacteria bacterium]|nr:HEAT repeat domain-containing protein [Deltaproteobacteria bacterium]MDQ3298161.1 HEAT repeat domain-containing protein [Myxococcota bacterium]